MNSETSQVKAKCRLPTFPTEQGSYTDLIQDPCYRDQVNSTLPWHCGTRGTGSATFNLQIQCIQQKSERQIVRRHSNLQIHQQIACHFSLCHLQLLVLC